MLGAGAILFILTLMAHGRRHSFSFIDISKILCSPLPDMAKEETEIQTQIMEYLEAKGYIVTKFNNGAHKVKGGVRGRRAKNTIGVSDLIVCSPEGRFCAIEVKKADGKLSKEQIDFLDRVRLKGGVAIAAFCLEDISSTL